jgi:hypothetical protein
MTNEVVNSSVIFWFLWQPTLASDGGGCTLVIGQTGDFEYHYFFGLLYSRSSCASNMIRRPQIAPMSWSEPSTRFSSECSSLQCNAVIVLPSKLLRSTQHMSTGASAFERLAQKCRSWGSYTKRFHQRGPSKTHSISEIARHCPLSSFLCSYISFCQRHSRGLGTGPSKARVYSISKISRHCPLCSFICFRLSLCQRHSHSLDTCTYAEWQDML